MTIPLILVGDAPNQTTGVSRIVTELGDRIWAHRESLGVELMQVGFCQQGPLPDGGILIHAGVPWPVVAHQDTESWGAVALENLLKTSMERERAVILYIGGPDRAYPFMQLKRKVDDYWGYLAVDGENPKGTIGGPADVSIQQFDRVIAYGEYGRRVIGRIRPDDDPTVIPHGINLEVFNPVLLGDEREAAMRILNPTGEPAAVIGCVATNHERKDLGLFLDVLARVRKYAQKYYGLNVRGWLHVDRQIGEAWSVPQLAENYGLDWRALTVTDRPIDSRRLATMYACCAATFAPGRGEGFGYPILESLACGTPAIHVDYAGGAALTLHDYRAVPSMMHAEGLYGLLRPCLLPGVVEDRILPVLNDLNNDLQRPVDTTQQCVAHAEPYGWEHVWPMWQAWLTRELEGVRS